MALYKASPTSNQSSQEAKKKNTTRILTGVFGGITFVCTIIMIAYIAFEDTINEKLDDMSTASNNAFATTVAHNSSALSAFGATYFGGAVGIDQGQAEPYDYDAATATANANTKPKESLLQKITKIIANVPKVAIIYGAFGLLVLALILYYISLIFTTLFAAALKVPSDPSYEDIARNDMRDQMINSVNSVRAAFKRKGLFYPKIIFAFHIPIVALMLLAVALIAFKYRADLVLKKEKGVEPEPADAIPKEVWIMVAVLCTIVYISIALTFFMYLAKMKKLDAATSGASYELLLANNLAAHDGEFMGAIKEYLKSSWKVNPYSWPPMTIERSFDDSPEGVENMVRMMLTYRLASYFATNVASFDNDARAGIVDSLSASNMLRTRLAGLGNALSLVNLKSGNTFSTDMTPTNRFTADASTQSYDDVAALNELFRCPVDGCPDGKLTFAQFHAKYFNEIDEGMRGISNDLLQQVSTSSFGQQMSYRYELSMGYSRMFTGVHKLLPLILIFIAMGFSVIVLEGKARMISAGSLLILFIVPLILERKVKSFGGF
jgi:hypothetical protein